MNFNAHKSVGKNGNTVGSRYARHAVGCQYVTLCAENLPCFIFKNNTSVFVDFGLFCAVVKHNIIPTLSVLFERVQKVQSRPIRPLIHSHLKICGSVGESKNIDFVCHYGRSRNFYESGLLYCGKRSSRLPCRCLCRRFVGAGASGCKKESHCS